MNEFLLSERSSILRSTWKHLNQPTPERIFMDKFVDRRGDRVFVDLRSLPSRPGTGPVLGLLDELSEGGMLTVYDHKPLDWLESLLQEETSGSIRGTMHQRNGEEPFRLVVAK